MKAGIVGLVTVVVAGGLVAPVQADPIIPIVVTSGSWVFPPAVGTFAGNGISLVAGFPDFLTIGDMTGCDPCSPARNDAIDLSTGFPFVGTASGTFDGVSYNQAFIDGGMQITAPTIFAGGLSADHTMLTAPFSMIGTLAGFPTAAELDANLRVGVTSGAIVNDPPGTVTGSGTVTAQFKVDPAFGLGTLFQPTSITYQFRSAPPLTPEPTSLLLFGTGIGLVWRRVCA